MRLLLYYSVLILLFMSPYARSAVTNSVQAQMKVNIAPAPTCIAGIQSARTNLAADSLDFGSITPDQIQDAPPRTGITENILMNASNLNSIYSSDQRKPTHTLLVSCDKELSSPSMIIRFSGSNGGTTTAGGFPLFKLSNNDINATQLAFAIFAKDRRSQSPARISQPLVHLQNLYLQVDSFARISSVTPPFLPYQANIDLYPALFWISPNSHNFLPTTIQSTIVTDVQYN